MILNENMLGIIQQTICPYTSQQNGVEERMHRHILDVARTLTFNVNVPKSYWADTVLTAVSLISHMPSSILVHKSPFSLLSPSISPFNLTPRVFGCVAFVHCLGLDKFSPRSVKCVFSGYSYIQKGYRCYDPNTHQYYTSADVTFFELSVFFLAVGKLSTLTWFLLARGSFLYL